VCQTHAVLPFCLLIVQSEFLIWLLGCAWGEVRNEVVGQWQAWRVTRCNQGPAVTHTNATFATTVSGLYQTECAFCWQWPGIRTHSGCLEPGCDVCCSITSPTASKFCWRTWTSKPAASTDVRFQRRLLRSHRFTARDEWRSSVSHDLVVVWLIKKLGALDWTLAAYITLLQLTEWCCRHVTITVYSLTLFLQFTTRSEFSWSAVPHQSSGSVFQRRTLPFLGSRTVPIPQPQQHLPHTAVANFILPAALRTTIILLKLSFKSLPGYCGGILSRLHASLNKLESRKAWRRQSNSSPKLHALNNRQDDG
jgi:hypothetical protein